MMNRRIFNCTLILALAAIFGMSLHAQAPAPDISGTWQGTLDVGKGLRIVLKVSKLPAGGYKSVFYSIDQTPQPIPINTTTLTGTAIKLTITPLEASYEGTLGADGKSITGNWTQGGQPHALNFVLTTPDNAWAIPEPPKQMAADAKPTFDVVTIKPSVPDRPGKQVGFRGRHFMAINFNMNDLIAFAYGLHTKQIIGGEPWFGTELFDVDGVPDVEGTPSQKQMQMMVQKMLADRFKLTFHHEKKELAVYAITVAKGGPKLTKSESSPNDPMAFFFRKLGGLTVRNQTIAIFAIWMQSSVMDKPVVDQTGLTDRYDFTLNWTPDETQFAQFGGTGIHVPPTTDDPNAPPGLFTAIQEQLGLKMEPVKAPDDVIVIDHVEKPSAN